jgi:hypothetical protein
VKNVTVSLDQVFNGVNISCIVSLHPLLLNAIN